MSLSFPITDFYRWASFPLLSNSDFSWCDWFAELIFPCQSLLLHFFCTPLWHLPFYFLFFLVHIWNMSSLTFPKRIRIQKKTKIIKSLLHFFISSINCGKRRVYGTRDSPIRCWLKGDTSLQMYRSHKATWRFPRSILSGQSSRSVPHWNRLSQRKCSSSSSNSWHCHLSMELPCVPKECVATLHALQPEKNLSVTNCVLNLHSTVAISPYATPPCMTFWSTKHFHRFFSHGAITIWNCTYYVIL